MRLLVTGGAGFIGSHSVDLLLARGHQVRVLDDLSSGKRDNLQAHPALELVIGDIRDRDTVQAVMAGIDGVLHLAAQVFVSVSIDQPVFSASVNVLGTVQVLDAARLAGVRRVVYASSAAIYGTPEALPVAEDTPSRPLSPYGLEKLIDEQYAALFQGLYGLSCCGMRYFNVYGPRQDPRSTYSGVISRFQDAIAAGRPLTVFGDGLQTRDFVSVFDVARATCAALTEHTSVEGVVNVATGTSITLLDLIAALGRAAGRALEVQHLPGRAGEGRDSRVVPTRMWQELGVRGAAIAF